MNRVVDGLWIGDLDDAREHGAAFDDVVTLRSEAEPVTTVHVPLEDGSNPWDAWVAAVDAVRDVYRSDGRALVHCREGVSRSAAVVSTGLAAELGWSWGEALDTVQEARPRALPNPSFYVWALSYCFATETAKRG